jgi:hypothetical protein
LFWAPSHGRHVSISAGSLDQPTGLRAGPHQYLEHAPDYDRERPNPGRPPPASS